MTSPTTPAINRVWVRDSGAFPGIFGTESFGFSWDFVSGAFTVAGAAGSGAGAGFFIPTDTASGVFAAGDALASAGAGVPGTAETGGTGCTATSFPHDSQNFAFGRSGAPHCSQAGVCSIFAPQDSQNFMPAVIGLLHFGHSMGVFAGELFAMSIHRRNCRLQLRRNK